MPYDSEVRLHIKSLCSKDYREADQMLKELEFMDWPEDSKAEIKKFYEHKKALNNISLKLVESIQINQNHSS